jgi:hypothetical protein
MDKMKLIAGLLCLALILGALAGCTPVPKDAYATEAPQVDGETPSAGEAGGNDAPAPQGQSADPAPTPTPAPARIHLSAGDFDNNQETLRAVITAADLPLLEGFYQLKTADFSGSDCQEELVAWALAHPQVSVRCEARLPDGTLLPADTRELDLTGTADLSAYQCLVLLPELTKVELGSCGDAASSPMNWGSLAALEGACPQAEFRYSFTLYGKRFDLQSTEMDLNHITMNDEGALVKQVALCMPRLSYLDMDFCEVSDEAMADIRDSLPQAEVVWRIWFGNGRTGYSVRTNVTRILASNPDRAGNLDPEHCKSLKYCTKVVYLDLGHNDKMTDISFVSYMPDLEVAILGMGGFSDISALADCPKLEYLELQTAGVTDLRPLSGLKNLRHLNLCYSFSLTDITPLYELTELERLWLGMFDPIPPEQIEEMQRRAPNCVINTTTEDPTGGGWRYTGTDNGGHGVLHPRYQELWDQFNYGAAPRCYSYYNNDPLYYPHN